MRSFAGSWARDSCPLRKSNQDISSPDAYCPESRVCHLHRIPPSTWGTEECETVAAGAEESRVVGECRTNAIVVPTDADDVTGIVDLGEVAVHCSVSINGRRYFVAVSVLRLGKIRMHWEKPKLSWTIPTITPPLLIPTNDVFTHCCWQEGIISFAVCSVCLQLRRSNSRLGTRRHRYMLRLPHRRRLRRALTVIGRISGQRNELDAVAHIQVRR